MKYERIILDDESIDAVCRRKAMGNATSTDLPLAQSAYLTDLARQVRSERRIIALAAVPKDSESLDCEDEDDLLCRQIMVTEANRIKTESYPNLQLPWEVVAVDGVSSARIVGTLAGGATGDGETLIVTADERLLAFVGDSIDILIQEPFKEGAQLWTAGSFQEAYGFSPMLYPIYRTLTCVDIPERGAFMGRGKAIAFLKKYPNIVDLVDAYISHSLILEEELRSSLRSLSIHIAANIGLSNIRACPKLVGLYCQSMNERIGFERGGGSES